MVIWPEVISSDDDGWMRACALFRVLALNPRQPLGAINSRLYYESADDILIRPMIYIGMERVPAPYFSYCLRFNVSASVHGRIPVDAADQLEVFRRTINMALQNPLTVAERKRWEATSEFRKCCAANDTRATEFAKVARDEGRRADRYYNEVRESIEAPRRYTAYGAASLSRHEEVLDGLVRLGTT